MAKYFFIVVLYSTIGGTWAQTMSFAPEAVVGYRSFAYMHGINVRLGRQVSLSNLAIYDAAYNSDHNNIFFIRNSIALRLHPAFAVNAFGGIKNPGSFWGAAVEWRFVPFPALTLSYAAGPTYQRGFTLEQSIKIVYAPRLSKTWTGYLSLLLIGNTNFRFWPRSLLYARVGAQHNKLIWGIGIHIDRFNNRDKELHNVGPFIKYQF
jgi:hypothetical protein